MKGIYKITNKKNGKIYIGQSIHCGKRLDEHCKGKQYIDKVIEENGIENFTFEILKEVNDNKKLSYWEDYYIHLYDSLYPNGYNKRLNTNIEINISKEEIKKEQIKNRDRDNLRKFYSNIHKMLKEEYFNSSILMLLIYIKNPISVNELYIRFSAYERKFFIKKNLALLVNNNIIFIDNNNNINLIDLPKEIILNPFFKNAEDIIKMKKYNSRIVLLTFLNNIFNAPTTLQQCLKLFPLKYKENKKKNKIFIKNCILEVQCKYPFLEIQNLRDY